MNAAPVSAPAVELTGVSRWFGPVPAALDISFSIRKGTIAALLGPSGCGKSTTLRMIAGFVEPTEGAIRIAGRDMRGVRPYERNVGLVFQDYALFPHMTVEQNVAYGLRQRRYPRAEIGDRVAQLIRLVRLGGLEQRRPASLSGGQQQRVAVARALATEPELVLLDEPLSALDAKLRQELRTELKEILRAVGSTTIVVTHDQEEAMSLAEHIIIMGSNRILQQGTPLEIYLSPATREVATFIGRSNWLEGRLGPATGESRRELTVDGGRILVASGVEPEDLYDVCIRPERLRMIADGQSSAHVNVLEGRVVDVVHLGAETHTTIELSSGRRLLAIEHDRGAVTPIVGERQRLGFDPRDCVLIRRIGGSRES